MISFINISTNLANLGVIKLLRKKDFDKILSIQVLNIIFLYYTIIIHLNTFI
jgi:hypothetical protein